MADSWYPASNYETPVVVVTSGDGVESRDGIVTDDIALTHDQCHRPGFDSRP